MIGVLDHFLYSHTFYAWKNVKYLQRIELSSLRWMKNFLKLKQTKHRCSYNSNLFTFKLLFTFGLGFSFLSNLGRFCCIETISSGLSNFNVSYTMYWYCGEKMEVVRSYLGFPAKDTSSARYVGLASLWVVFHLCNVQNWFFTTWKKYQKHTVNIGSSDLRTDFCDWHRQGAITSGGGGGTPRKPGLGVRPAIQNTKSVIFFTIFLTWPKIWFPIYDAYGMYTVGLNITYDEISLIVDHLKWWKSTSS